MEDTCEICLLDGDLSYLKFYHFCGGKATPRLIEASIRYGKETGNYECYKYLMDLQNQFQMDILVAQMDYCSIRGDVPPSASHGDADMNS